MQMELLYQLVCLKYSKIQAYLPPRDKFDDLGIGIWGLMILIAFLKGNIGWTFPRKCLEKSRVSSTLPPPPPPPHQQSLG